MLLCITAVWNGGTDYYLGEWFMENIMKTMKNLYLFEKWERRKLEKSDMYFPVMLKLADKEGFVIERSVAPVKIEVL